MKHVLILGAGMVSKPIINYLLKKNYSLTVASPVLERAQQLIDNHPLGEAVYWTSEDSEMLHQLVEKHQIVVSLLPWSLHHQVAKVCIAHAKNMLTTSYVQPEMQELHEEAKAKGVLILNELGLDPGIDHMSAMRIIDSVHAKGGKIEEFYSFCGALPAPEAASNPFGYKFSWSPKGVIMAGNNEGKFLRHGKLHTIPSIDLFKNPIQVDFPEIGLLEVYPNRDSLNYKHIYGIDEAKTLMRGTFRYPGFCESMDVLKALNLLSTETYDFSNKTYRDMLKELNALNAENIEQKIADKLGISIDSHAIKAMKWLGLFDAASMDEKQNSPIEITGNLMIDKMELKANERDMVVMQHIFRVSYEGKNPEIIKSSMVDYGMPATDTAISRTVALPAAIGTELILQGKINLSGVHIPVLPEIYNPILDHLESLNIKMEEEFGLPLTENIG